jgi:hypothetical protein
MPTVPIRFVDEPIEAIFNEPPVLIKAPPCPSAFVWRGETYPVIEMLEVWQNFQRRGRFARNMRPSHATKASKSGSWGVGRFHYVVRVEDGRIFEIYYDRAPESAGDRLGHWFLLYERKIE